MDLFEIGDELKYISQLLQTIRNLSKGNTTDFRHAPYSDDAGLLKHLLHEKINELSEQNKR
jgi:hypothetical protein